MGEEPKNFHDVARPGSTPQSSTSRPIIVNREPLMQDPMMKGSPQPEKPALPDHDDEPIVAPPTLKATPAKAESAPTTPTPEAPPESEASTAIRSSIPPNPPKPSEDKVLQEASDKVQGLIESKTYAVPVGHLQRKRKLRVIVIIVAVVLVIGIASGLLIASSM